MKKIGFLILGIALVLGAFSALRTWVLLPKGEIVTERLSCSMKDYVAYTKIMPEAGEMGLPFSPDAGDVSTQLDLLAAYESLDLSGGQTVVVVADLASKTLFTQTCTGERCTMDEQGFPMRACLLETRSDCVYLATRFRGQDYCLIEPSQGE